MSNGIKKESNIARGASPLPLHFLLELELANLLEKTGEIFPNTASPKAPPRQPVNTMTKSGGTDHFEFRDPSHCTLPLLGQDTGYFRSSVLGAVVEKLY